MPKTAILLIVVTLWALISSRQGQIITVTAPVRLHGIPERLALVRSTPEEVDVQLKSFSILTPLPSKLDISADVDLSSIREGQSSVRIKNSDFRLPSGMEMTAVTPSSVRVVTDRKERRRVPVRVALRRNTGRGLREWSSWRTRPGWRLRGLPPRWSVSTRLPLRRWMPFGCSRVRSIARVCCRLVTIYPFCGMNRSLFD